MEDAPGSLAGAELAIEALGAVDQAAGKPGIAARPAMARKALAQLLDGPEARHDIGAAMERGDGVGDDAGCLVVLATPDEGGELGAGRRPLDEDAGVVAREEADGAVAVIMGEHVGGLLLVAVGAEELEDRRCALASDEIEPCRQTSRSVRRRGSGPRCRQGAGRCRPSG